MSSFHNKKSQILSRVDHFIAKNSTNKFRVTTPSFFLGGKCVRCNEKKVNFFAQQKKGPGHLVRVEAGVHQTGNFFLPVHAELDDVNVKRVRSRRSRAVEPGVEYIIWTCTLNSKKSYAVCEKGCKESFVLPRARSIAIANAWTKFVCLFVDTVTRQTRSERVKKFHVLSVWRNDPDWSWRTHSYKCNGKSCLHEGWQEMRTSFDRVYN